MPVLKRLKALLHPFAGMEQDKLVDQLLRRQRLLVNGRLTVGRGFERKDWAHWLAGPIGHGDVVSGVGLKVGEGGAVIVAVHLFDGADLRLLKVIAVGSVVQIQVRALF